MIEYLSLDSIDEYVYKHWINDFISWFRGSMVPFFYLEVLNMAKMAKYDPGNQKNKSRQILASFWHLDKFSIILQVKWKTL